MTICIKDKIKNINAVIGCNIGCRYCYAKAVANRFHLTDDFSKPIADLHKLERLKKPGVYFLTGMSDLYLWKKEWLDKSFELLRESPKTVGVYLTKAPNKIKLDDVPDNAWMGVTITSKSDLWKTSNARTITSRLSRYSRIWATLIYLESNGWSSERRLANVRAR